MFMSGISLNPSKNPLLRPQLQMLPKPDRLSSMSAFFSLKQVFSTNSLVTIKIDRQQSRMVTKDLQGHQGLSRIAFFG